VYTVNPFEETGITLPKLQAIFPLQWRRCAPKVIEQAAAVDMLQYQAIPPILYKGTVKPHNRGGGVVSEVGEGGDLIIVRLAGTLHLQSKSVLV